MRDATEEPLSVGRGDTASVMNVLQSRDLPIFDVARRYRNRMKKNYSRVLCILYKKYEIETIKFEEEPLN